MQVQQALISLVLYITSCLQSPVWWRNINLERRKWLVGLLFIVAVSLIWVVASFVVQEVEAEGLHPFLLSYIANSLFIVYLPIHWLSAKGASSVPDRDDTEDNEEKEDFEETGLRRESTQSAELEDGQLFSVSDLARSNAAKQSFWSPFQEKEVFKAAAVVAPLWFLAQYTFNTSLNLTSVTSNTILSSTSSLFTYGLSCSLALERLAVRKLAFIILCMAGVSLVAYVDERSSESKSAAHSSLVGDLLCVLSACFYASYTIAIRVMLKDDESTSMMLFFGFVGALNLVCLAPVLGLLWLASVVDPGQLSGKMFGLTVAKGLFDNALSDYLWARAVLLIGPTVATLGLSLQFPIATGADVVLTSPRWLHNGSWPLMLVGAAAILGGFFGINVERWPCMRGDR